MSESQHDRRVSRATEELVQLAPNGFTAEQMPAIEAALDALEGWDVDDFITDLWRAKDEAYLREACYWAGEEMIQTVVNVLIEAT
jgi:hypothetical protein